MENIIWKPINNGGAKMYFKGKLICTVVKEARPGKKRSYFGSDLKNPQWYLAAKYPVKFIRHRFERANLESAKRKAEKLFQNWLSDIKYDYI